jgi:AraC-like DNA-binding protein
MTEPSRLRFVPPCAPGDAQLERTSLLRGTHLLVERIEGRTGRTLTTQAELPLDGGALVFSLEGTVLYRTDREPAWKVVSPKSVTFAESPALATIRVARGMHDLIVTTWRWGALPVLESWLEARRQNKAGMPRALGSQPIEPSHKDAYGRFIRSVETKEASSEHMVAAVVLELASALLQSDVSHSLAAAPKDLPELMIRLIEAVRENPSIPWPLKEAADFVGYSPFHFSRIFKQQVGMGFHEFVDRTRTEYATHLLTTTDHAIDVVASEAGFGTTQGLRESVKEYLGLVPSELRTVPEGMD